MDLTYEDNVLTVRDDTVNGDWEQWWLLISDLHWDNPHCQRNLLRKHLEQAKEKDAGVLVFGDLFCAMQGKYDPRRDKSNVRPEHNVGDYLDSLVDTAASWFEPYVNDRWLITPGNHETSILSKLETNLTKRLAEKLDIQHAGYSGVVRFLFSRNGKSGTSRNLYWHHGHGGGGPVTKGVIQTNRRAAYLGEIDVVVSGHVHEAWQVEVEQLRVSTHGKLYTATQHHLSLATYKDEYTPEGGFHVERGRPPKPLGGYWLHFYYTRNTHGRVGMQLIRTEQ